MSLFDGKTLDGWKVGENADIFQVRDGMIVMECPATTHGPAHLFYVGEVSRHDFKNFDLKVDVMTFPGANSGIYFHTKYQEAGWPDFGMECQINNSHADWRRTGSLWGIRNISWGPETPPKNNKENVTILPKPPVTDNVWYTQEVIYQDGLVTVKLDGKTMFEYRLPQADIEHKTADQEDLVAAGHLRPSGAPADAGPYQQGVLQEHPRQGLARLSRAAAGRGNRVLAVLRGLIRGQSSMGAGRRIAILFNVLGAESAQAPRTWAAESSDSPSAPT